MAVITIANSEMIMLQQRGEVISTAGISIADGSIDNDAMADNAINTAEIVNDAVTADKLANSINTEIAANTAKTGITSGQANAITANTAKVTNATHTGDVTGATALTIAAGAVDMAMLATTAGTAGSGTFLRGDGQWQAAGGGALTLIGSVTASNSSTLGFTGISGTYENYLLLGSDLVPASDHRQFQLQFGDSGSIHTGSSDYMYHLQEVGSASTGYAARVDASAVFIEVGNKVGNTAGEGLGFTLWINRPGNGTMYPTIHGTHIEWDKDGVLIGGVLVGARVAVITMTQIQIKLNAGNIGSGELSLYGVKNA
jgi:hypothetical protein